jgi:putative ABC transport system ATP-binding protein
VIQPRGSNPVISTKQALCLQQIQFSWPGAKVPSLDIPEWHVGLGEKVFLSGESGSGKSTLLQLIAGVYACEQGSIEVLGQNLRALSQSRRDDFRATHLGFVFQMFNLLPFLSVTDNVLLPTRFSRVRRNRAAEHHLGQPKKAAFELLNALDIATLEHRPVGTLSVGQQQRVALARALIGEPELIICDEPTSAIDMPQRDAFMHLLMKQVERTGATLIFVSHDPSLASYFDSHVRLNDINKASGLSR